LFSILATTKAYSAKKMAKSNQNNYNKNETRVSNKTFVSSA